MNLDTLKKDTKKLRFVIEKLFTFSDVNPEYYGQFDSSSGNVKCLFHGSRTASPAKMYVDEVKNIDVVHCYGQCSRNFSVYDFIERLIDNTTPYEYLLKHRSISEIEPVLKAIEDGYVDYDSKLMEQRIKYVDSVFEEVDNDVVEYIEKLYN